jgi:hypothetical protein
MQDFDSSEKMMNQLIPLCKSILLPLKAQQVAFKGVIPKIPVGR